MHSKRDSIGNKELQNESNGYHIEGIYRDAVDKWVLWRCVSSTEYLRQIGVDNEERSTYYSNALIQVRNGWLEQEKGRKFMQWKKKEEVNGRTVMTWMLQVWQNVIVRMSNNTHQQRHPAPSCKVKLGIRIRRLFAVVDIYLIKILCYLHQVDFSSKPYRLVFHDRHLYWWWKVDNSLLSVKTSDSSSCVIPEGTYPGSGGFVKTLC